MDTRECRSDVNAHRDIQINLCNFAFEFSVSFDLDFIIYLDFTFKFSLNIAFFIALFFDFILDFHLAKLFNLALSLGFWFRFGFTFAVILDFALNI